MTLRDEIMTIEKEIASILKGVTFYRQNMPKNHSINEVTIEAMSSDIKSETTFHNIRSRSYRICYFGTSEIDVMSNMEKLEALFLKRIKLPLNDNHYLSVVDFSFSQAFETDSSDVYTSIGVLRINTKEAIEQDKYSKMTSINFEEIRR